MFNWLYNKLVPTREDHKLVSNPDTQREAREAAAAAKQGLESTVTNNEKVVAVTKKLEHQLEINHFALILERSMRGEDN